MTAEAAGALPGTGATARDGWAPHLWALGGVCAAVLVLFHRDAIAMARIWIDSSTYNHCALVLPIIGWLVWQRLPELRQLSPVAWAPGLLLVGAGAGGWLLGDAGGVALARHAGLVLMLQGATITCLGAAVARGLAFPIFYALFLIPAGDEIVPAMQTLTAEMCMALLALVGIPAHIDGIFITTSTGLFKVAEACAGVKFLVAMMALGALVANVCFRSWRLRALFLAASIVVPILANGVRAWGTIYIAHLTDLEMAAGFDHVVYGWIFFAIVIALLLGVGSRHFDRHAADPWFDARRLQPTPRSGPDRRLLALAAVAAALAAAPLAWSSAIARADAIPVRAEIAFPTVPGWHRVATPGDRYWEPRFEGAAALGIARYRSSDGHEVDLAIAIFARQEEGREMVGFGQGAAGTDSGWVWTDYARTPPDGRADRIASSGTVREVLTFYRIGGILTGSEYRVKLETMKARLLGGPQWAAAVLVSAEVPASGTDPRPAIDAFARALGPIDALADRAASGEG